MKPVPLSPTVRSSSEHNRLAHNQWHPVAGWPLPALGAIAETEHAPDLLLFANRARAGWRQAVYLGLATETLDAARSSEASTLSGVLPTLTPAELVSRFIGRPGKRLANVLKKLGFEPLRPDLYRTLVHWYGSTDRDGRRFQILERCVSVDENRILAALHLDPVFLIPAVLDNVPDEQSALRLNSKLEVIRQLCSQASDEALEQSSQALQGKLIARRWAQSWLRRADLLPSPPFEGDNECAPVQSAGSLVDIARRFQNCLADRFITSALSGQVSIVEYRPEPALALLARLTNGCWLILGVHAPKNGPVSDVLQRKVRNKIMSFGPHILARHQPPPMMADVLREVFGGFDLFDVEWQWLQD